MYNIKLTGKNIISTVLMIVMLLSSFTAFAQSTISGTVQDESGSPLPGVSVVVRHDGKLNGTITESDGSFRIVADPSAEVEFICVGYQTVVMRADQNLMGIVMHEDKEFLDEVVVVGYGTQKKVNLTGAVTSVDSEILENRSMSSVTQMLQGAMPNVSVQVNTGAPGAGGTITVRGTGSINSSSPLILVDGIPGSIDQLNPNDIETISVLKDASSAAIYGARAAFGVILVNTKAAKEGKAKVSYDTYFSWSTPTVKTDFVWQGYDHAYIYDTSYMGQKGVMGAATGYTESDYEQLLARRNDRTEHPDRPWVVEDEDGKYNYYANFDWWKYLYEKWMPSQSHNISISGGNDKLNYFVSGNFYTKDGLMRNAKERYDKYTITAKLSGQVNNWMRITNTTNFFDSEHMFPGENAANGAFARTNINCAPSYVPIGPDGNWTGMMKSGKVINEGRIADIYGGVSKGNVGKRRFRNTFAVSITPIEGLRINADYTFGFTMDDNWKRQGLVYVSTGYADKTQLSTSTAHKTDYYEQEMSFNPQHVVNAYANYDKTFSGHSISLTAGMNYEMQSNKSLYGYRTDVMSDSLNDLNMATGGVTVGPDGKIIGEIKATGGASAYELFGLFFRANYNYKERYFIELNGRYDGSSRFFAENRFGFFPSVSAAWRISEEKWMENATFVDNLKLRASYGVLGNQLGVAIYPYSTIAQKQSTYIIDGNLSYYLTTPAPVSGDYTWEKVSTSDVGLDASFLGNRLTFTGDYFIRTTSGMYVDGVTLPGVFGAEAPRQNAGEMKTYGYELALSWRDDFKIGGQVFNYEVFGSFGDANSWITKYQGNDAGLLDDYYVGMNIGEIWGYRTGGQFVNDDDAAKWTAKIDQSYVGRDIFEKSVGEWAVARGGDLRYLDLNDDKKIDHGNNTIDDHGDLEIIGNSTPRYNYGFGANLSYFGFDFSITFQGIGKCDLYPNKEMEKFWGSWGRVNSAFLPQGLAEQAWSEKNPDGYFPQLERGGAAYLDRGQLTTVNDHYLQSLAYLRLKNLSFGYTIPEKWTEKLHIKRLRLYFSGDNLCYWSPFHTDYVDPEQAMASSDARIYPFSKTFTFGLNLTF